MDHAVRGDEGYSWEVIRDESGLDRLAPEWTALNARCGAEGFFSRMEIVRANWDRHRDDPRTALHVVAVRERGRLVIGAPMIRRRDRLGTHTLHWLDSKTPFYDGLLVDPAMDVATAARLFDRILGASWTRRLLKIGFVAGDGTLHGVLAAAGLPLTFRTVAPSVDVSRHATWEAYLAATKAKRRQQFGNFSRRLQKAGAGPVHLVTDPGERRDEIARLFSRKRQWVQEQALEDWIVPPEAEAWFQTIAAREDERNRTRLLRLSAGPVWIASVLCFERDGSLFLSKMAHDPDWDRFSPGWILMMEVVRFAIGQKLATVDFMIGRSQWKNRLSDRQGAIYSCRARLLPWQRNRPPENGEDTVRPE